MGDCMIKKCKTWTQHGKNIYYFQIENNHEEKKATFVLYRFDLDSHEQIVVTQWSEPMIQEEQSAASRWGLLRAKTLLKGRYVGEVSYPFATSVVFPTHVEATNQEISDEAFLESLKVVVVHKFRFNASTHKMKRKISLRQFPDFKSEIISDNFESVKHIFFNFFYLKNSLK